MEICPGCQRKKWTVAAGNPDSPTELFCECPILKVEPYSYSEDEDGYEEEN